MDRRELHAGGADASAPAFPMKAFNRHRTSMVLIRLGVVCLAGWLTKHITAGADLANLLDNDHYEAFGGDLLGRRALGHLTYSW